MSPETRDLIRDLAEPSTATQLVDDEERGILAGRWARENIPDHVDRREGWPTITDVLAESGEWVRGYRQGAEA